MSRNDYFRIPTRLTKTMRLSRTYARHEADDLVVAPGAERYGGEKKQSQEFIGIFISEKRLWMVWWGIVIICGVLLLRLGYLQLFKGRAYLARAESNRLVTVYTPAARGFIYDNHKQLLVENSAQFSLKIDVSHVPKTSEERKAYLAKLGILVPFSSDEQDVFLHLDTTQIGDAVTLTNNLSYDAMLRVQSEHYRYPNLQIVESTKRRYVGIQDATSFAHIFGYLGAPSETQLAQMTMPDVASKAPVGKTGLEKTYDHELRGVPGALTYEVDVLGNKKRVISQEIAQPGAELILEIDADLQRFAEHALAKELTSIDRTRGVVVAMDPRNGAIRAMVSLPAYDPNIFVRGIDQASYAALTSNPDMPLFPRAVAGTYPSGSTFKLITGYAGLMERVITSRTTVLSTGGIAINQWFFPDWKAGGHGVTNLRKALAESVNTYFYAVGGGYKNIKGVGADALAGYAQLFGLGSSLGIDLPSEATGLVPTPAWKEATKHEKWYIGDTYHFAIGQGDILVTPLQVAAYTSVFANGSKLYQPHLKTRMENPSTGETISIFTPHVLHDFSDNAQYIHDIRDGMRAAVIEGSARRLSFLPIEVAGKTGTAQWNSTKENHAWFTGFAPYNNAELVVTVLIEEGGEGSSVSVPVARDIFQWYADHRMQ